MHGWRVVFRTTMLLLVPRCLGYVATALSRNAFRGDGSLHAQLDATTAAGLAPTVVARRLLRAIAQGDAEVVDSLCNTKTWLALRFRGFVPRLWRSYTARRARKRVGV